MRAPTCMGIEVLKQYSIVTFPASLTQDEENIILEVTNKLRQRKARQQLVRFVY